jgi:hypothetical protein
MHKYLSTTHRNVAWFKQAYDGGQLDVKAPYQRNPVWSDRQKAALIDTILLEYPIPELYMQELVDAEGKQRHVVVDGQQRVAAVLGFLGGEFELGDDSPVAPGLSFDELALPDRKKIFEYSFVVRLLPEMPEEEIRIIFQRINRNTVVLNSQELRRATYWGPFITLMEQLSDLEYWSEFSIFSANDRRRMLDIEFISELAVGHLNGPQNKKRTLEEFYQIYETQFDGAEELKSVFMKTLGELSQLLPELSKTRWRKKSDFYSLFLCLAKQHGRLPLSLEARDRVRHTLIDFSIHIDDLMSERSDPGQASEDSRAYVRAVERAASDLGSRRTREQVIDRALAAALG